MIFKVGDRVRFSEAMDGKRHCPEVEFDNLIREIIENDGYNIKLKDLPENSFNKWELDLVDTSKFTKSDLQEGDIVTDREGCKSLFHNGALRGRTLSIYDLTDDLKDKEGKSDNDIVKVERPIKLETVFERKEPEVIEMTMTELCEHFGCKVKIVKEKE